MSSEELEIFCNHCHAILESPFQHSCLYQCSQCSGQLDRQEKFNHYCPRSFNPLVDPDVYCRKCHYHCSVCQAPFCQRCADLSINLQYPIQPRCDQHLFTDHSTLPKRVVKVLPKKDQSPTRQVKANQLVQASVE